MRSFDVWGFGGRGDLLGANLGNEVFWTLFSDKKPPHISWIIWQGKQWRHGVGWIIAPGRPPDSDPGHFSHIHVTYLEGGGE
jgi:hypothetical protein